MFEGSIFRLGPIVFVGSWKVPRHYLKTYSTLHCVSGTFLYKVYTYGSCVWSRTILLVINYWYWLKKYHVRVLKFSLATNVKLNGTASLTIVCKNIHFSNCWFSSVLIFSLKSPHTVVSINGYCKILKNKANKIHYLNETCVDCLVKISTSWYNTKNPIGFCCILHI